jgi:hypothetical protein
MQYKKTKVNQSPLYIGTLADIGINLPCTHITTLIPVL